MAEAYLQAESGRATSTHGALGKLFEERLATYVFAHDRLEVQPDDAEQDDVDHYVNAYLYAEDRMLSTPASDLSDLRAKAETLWGDPDNHPNREEVLPFLADLVRLTGREPSRVFSAQQWLRRFERAGGMWVVRDDEVIILEPVDRDLSDLLGMLRAMDGAEAVKALVWRKQAMETTSVLEVVGREVEGGA